MERLENFLNPVCRNANALVANRDPDFRHLNHHLELYPSVRVGEFDGIIHQLGNHPGDHFLVSHRRRHNSRAVQQQANIAFCRQRPVALYHGLANG